jgi:hypothetical protein
LEVLKFNLKDWVKWYNLISSYFRRMLGVHGVMVDWVYREQERPMPRAMYQSIADELKAMIILKGSHFTEDLKTVYASVASLMLNTPAYAHVKHFEEQNGREAMLTLKVQFSGTAFNNMSQSNTAHNFLKEASFSGPKRGYTYLEHVVNSRTPSMSLS